MNKRIRKKRGVFGYPDWYAKEAIPRADYTLLITFKNGKRRIFDLKPFLDDLAAPLKEDRDWYMHRILGGGTVHWGEMGEVSIAPEYIYENSQPVPKEEIA